MIKSNDHFIYCLLFIAFWILDFRMYNLILAQSTLNLLKGRIVEATGLNC